LSRCQRTFRTAHEAQAPDVITIDYTKERRPMS
jgi:hypothetical protein